MGYLRLRIQWMSDGAMSMRGNVKSADRQRWSCKSSLTSCRAHSDSRGALLHSLDLLIDSASTVPFSASLCFLGAWKDGGKLDFQVEFDKNQPQTDHVMLVVWLKNKTIQIKNLTRFNMWLKDLSVICSLRTWTRNDKRTSRCVQCKGVNTEFKKV